MKLRFLEKWDPESASSLAARVGRRGEDRACQVLWKKGFRILERNYRFEKGEIDVIAEKRQCVHFVEVKAQTGAGIGDPGERVDSDKRRLIRKTAQAYLDDFRDPPLGGTCFDVFTVIFDRDMQVVKETFQERAF